MTREQFEHDLITKAVATGTKPEDAERYAKVKWETIQWERQVERQRKYEMEQMKRGKAAQGRRL